MSGLPRGFVQGSPVGVAKGRAGDDDRPPLCDMLGDRDPKLSSQGQRSASINGVPARIFADIRRRMVIVPFEESRASAGASLLPTVVLPLPLTPIRTIARV